MEQQNTLHVVKYSYIRINSCPPGQNGRHFSDEIFSRIFVNEKFCILIEIPLKFVPKGSIDNNTGSDNGLAPNDI